MNENNNIYQVYFIDENDHEAKCLITAILGNAIKTYVDNELSLFMTVHDLLDPSLGCVQSNVNPVAKEILIQSPLFLSFPNNGGIKILKDSPNGKGSIWFNKEFIDKFINDLDNPAVSVQITDPNERLNFDICINTNLLENLNS